MEMKIKCQFSQLFWMVKPQLADESVKVGNGKRLCRSIHMNALSYLKRWVTTLALSRCV